MERIITLQPMLSLSYIGFDKLDTQLGILYGNRTRIVAVKEKQSTVV